MLYWDCKEKTYEFQAFFWWNIDLEEKKKRKINALTPLNYMELENEQIINYTFRLNVAAC